MAFFDDLGKKISSAGQSTIQKTKDMAGVAKTNSLISEEERRINIAYTQIGTLYYSKHANDAEDEFKELIAKIQDSENKIKTYKEQVKTLKGVVRCEKCGAEVNSAAAFCNACGAPMPKKVVAPPADSVQCPNCNAFVKKGMRFCTSCGTSMPQEEAPQAPVAPVQPVAEPQVAPVPQAKKCPNCGIELEADAVFCTECGTKV